ncbi:hypothetical protein EDB85DRAFT_1900076 [Lactarius pseudohatsudake]|nr:hypothetical protein EDB85DRAFT_1900076 [Lactarius pseudohatsudake]
MFSVGINIVSQLLRILADIGLRIVVGLVARAIYTQLTNCMHTSITRDKATGDCLFPPDGFHPSDRPALYWRQEMKTEAKTEVFNNRYNTQAGWAPVAPNVLPMNLPPVYPGIVHEE